MTKFPKSNAFFEVDHSADVAFVVCGDSLENLFLQSQYTLMEIAGVKKGREIKDEQSITFEALTKESLLIAFLNEILFFLEKEEWPEPLSLRLEKNQMHFVYQLCACKLTGQYIKAVTYNLMDIVHADKVFSTTIVFDV